MHNVKYSVANNKLVIEIDLSAKAVGSAVPSSTGKTTLLASSRGAEALTAPVGGKRCEFSINVTLKG